MMSVGVAVVAILNVISLVYASLGKNILFHSKWVAVAAAAAACLCAI